MIITIITITRNNGALLQRTIDSIYSQKLQKGVVVEHIIVNGGNTQEGEDIIAKAVMRGTKMIRRESKGCYNAINEGIKISSGDIIGLVHGNDTLASPDTLNRIADTFMTMSPDFVYGDVVFVNSATGKRTRYYSGKDFEFKHLSNGFAPPHPSLFSTRTAMKIAGMYNENFKIAGDFDFFIRLFSSKYNFNYVYLPGPAVVMESGGLSSRLLNRVFTNNIEKRRALRDNGVYSNWFKLISRYFTHFNFISRMQK